METFIRPIYNSEGVEVGVVISEQRNMAANSQQKRESERKIIEYVKDRYYPETVGFNYFSDINSDTPSIVAFKNSGLNSLDGSNHIL